MLVLFWDNMWSLNVQKPIVAKIQLDRFECTKTDICQDTARYVFCLFWSDLSIPGVGQKFHPEYFATKLFVMTACDILRWTVKFECTKIILSQDIVRYVFCLIWSIFIFTNSRGGVKMPSRTLCPKTICNDCLCYSEIIMWSLNVQKPIVAKIQLDMCFAYFGQICQYPGWGKNFIPNTLPQNYL